jgi:hypothetical protein
VVGHGQPGHRDRPEGHHGAIGEIDAGRQDDDGLADRQDADHRHLLNDQRPVFRGQEAVRPDREEERGEQESNEWTERRNQAGAGKGRAGIPADLPSPKPG